MCEGNNCFTRRGRPKAKALTGTTGIRESIWPNVYEVHNGRRNTRRTSVFSRADCLEYNLDELTNAYGKMMTRIGRLEDRGGVVAGRHASNHGGGHERGGNATLANGAIAKDLWHRSSLEMLDDPTTLQCAEQAPFPGRFVTPE